LISSENYKLLSIQITYPHTKFKKSILRKNNMKGLCQKCHSSNVEITLENGSPVCTKCAKK
jgi:formylmethanofuran dehydrogenase subunit E